MAGTVAIATIALILHTLAAVVWVGGMFFALLVLRPASGPLDPTVRLDLWLRVLERFFAWVWVAVVLLLLSGYGMIFGVFGAAGGMELYVGASKRTGFIMMLQAAGFSGLGLHIQIMQGLGIVMMLLFAHLYFAPWRRFRAAVARQDRDAAARQLDQIRWIVTINLVLGLLTVAVGSSGRYWG